MMKATATTKVVTEEVKEVGPVPQVNVDQRTAGMLRFAGAIAGMKPARWWPSWCATPCGAGRTHQAAAAQQSVLAAPAVAETVVALHADYDGVRTHATFHPVGGRIQIDDGPLAGRVFKTPSEAAKAVVRHHAPGITANRNGWTFWRLLDSGAPLSSLRKSHRRLCAV